MKFKAFLLIVIAALGGQIFGATAATRTTIPGARTDSGFGITPARAELVLEAGQTVHKSILIHNQSGEDRLIRLNAADFTAGPQGDAVLEQGAGDGLYSGKDWFSFELDNFELKQGEQIELDVIIEVPADAGAGGYFSTVLVSGVPINVEDASNVKLLGRVGSLFYMRVSGDVNESGHIEEFTTDRKVYQQGPIVFNSNFRNDGNVHLSPAGTLTVKNIFGTDIKTIEWPQLYVLPNISRPRTVSWDRDVLFGWYKAELDVKYGLNDKQSDKATISFIVFPLGTAGIVLTIIIILVILVLIIKRLIPSKKKKKQSEAAD